MDDCIVTQLVYTQIDSRHMLYKPFTNSTLAQRGTVPLTPMLSDVGTPSLRQALIDRVQRQFSQGFDGSTSMATALGAFLEQDPPMRLDLSHVSAASLDCDDLMADIIDFAAQASPHLANDLHIAWPHGMTEFPSWTILLPDWVRHAAPTVPIQPFGLATPESALIDFGADLRGGTMYSKVSHEGRRLASDYRRITCDAQLVIPRDESGQALNPAELLGELERHIAEFPSESDEPCWRVGYACGEDSAHSSPILVIREHGKHLVLVAETYQPFLMSSATLAAHARRLGLPVYSVPTASIQGHGCRAQTIRYIADVTGKDEQGRYRLDADAILADATQIGDGVFTVGRLPFAMVRHTQSSAFIDAHGPIDRDAVVHQRRTPDSGREDESWNQFAERTVEDNGSHRGWLRRAGLKLGLDALRAHYAEQFSEGAPARWCVSMKKDFLQQMTARIRASRAGLRPQASSADLENFARDVVALEDGLHRFGLQGRENFREMTTAQGRTLLEETVLMSCAAPVLLHHCLLSLEDLTITELSFALSLATRCKALQAVKKILIVARRLSPDKAAEVLGLRLPEFATPLRVAHQLADVEACEQLMNAMEGCAVVSDDHVQLLLAGIQVTQVMSRSMKARWEGAIDNLCESPDLAKNADFRALVSAFDWHLMASQS